MSVYLLSIMGGLFADRIMGSRRAVLAGGVTIAAGHFALAVPTASSFYLGLILIVLGTGLFKPSISALVGGLYAPGDPRRMRASRSSTWASTSAPSQPLS